MKRIALVFVLVALGSIGVAAYGSLSAYLDWIAPSGRAVTLIPMQAAGWVFDCGSGQIPASGTGVLLVDGVAVPALFTYGESRPDVQAAFVGSCPRITGQMGFHVDFYATPGRHQLDALISQPQGYWIIQQQPFVAQ